MDSQFAEEKMLSLFLRNFYLDFSNKKPSKSPERIPSPRTVKNSVFTVHDRLRPLVTLGQRPVSENISAIFYCMMLCHALDDVRWDTRPYIFTDAQLQEEKGTDKFQGRIFSNSIQFEKSTDYSRDFYGFNRNSHSHTLSHTHTFHN